MNVMNKYRAVIGVAVAIVALTLVGYFLLRGVHFDSLQPAGDIAKQQRNVLAFTLALMAIIVIPIFIMLALFGWKYREGNDKKPRYRPEWADNTHLEILWWGIPIIIITILAVTAWVTSRSLDPYKHIESDKQAVKVQVVALQWKWLFIYPDYGIATVNKLPIPEKTPIHFTLSADAPMSAFWIPTLGSQIYTMNGMSTQLNLIADHTGTFKGYNTNISGKGYSDMNFNVYSMTEHDFNGWVAMAKNSTNALNQAMYDKLAQPGLSDVATYTLSDSQIFNKVVNKYMNMDDMNNSSHGSDAGHDSDTHVMPDGTVMKNSQMEGM